MSIYIQTYPDSSLLNLIHPPLCSPSTDIKTAEDDDPAKDDDDHGGGGGGDDDDEC